MTLSDFLVATNGLPLTATIKVDFAGIDLEVVSSVQAGGVLFLQVATPHTSAMLSAQKISKTAVQALKDSNDSLAAARAQTAKLVAKRVQDFVDRDLVHVPPNGPDEAALLERIKNGDV